MDSLRERGPTTMLDIVVERAVWSQRITLCAHVTACLGRQQSGAYDGSVSVEGRGIALSCQSLQPPCNPLMPPRPS
jgi:hypothetical protein